MSTRLPEHLASETATMFNVLVVYDDVIMGARAKHVLDSVTRTLGPDYRPVVNIWKFSMLHLPALADSAVLEAIAAHMIIVALCEDNGMPQATKLWIETWLPQRASAAGALVLLFDPAVLSSTAVSSTHNYLLNVGQRGNLDVFALRNEPDWDDLQWVCAECNRIHAASPSRNAMLGPPSNRLGQSAPSRPPLQVTISTPSLTRTIRVA